MRRLLPRGYLFTVLGIAVGVAGLVALGAMAERISLHRGRRPLRSARSRWPARAWDGRGLHRGRLLRAAKIAEIARVPAWRPPSRR